MALSLGYGRRLTHIVLFSRRILEIKNMDRHEALQQAIARGEITWRCWWDGDKDSGGPLREESRLDPPYTPLSYCPLALRARKQADAWV